MGEDQPMSASPAADLVRSKFLEGLPGSDRAIILAAASQRRVLANSVVANPGEPADYLFLITKGCARYFYITPEGRKIVFFWLTAGQISGGAALLSEPSDYLVGTEMVKDSSVLVWHRSKIRALAVRFPMLLDNVLSIASDYLTWYLAAHLSLVCHTARQRLAHVLVSLARGIGQQHRAGVQLDITNEQLANAANITLFTTSRLMGQWQRSGAVVKSRGKIILRSPEGLFLP
jgi:CRP/FNR family transcriptional regulator, nitrogen oxide reductase regulator